MNIIFPVPCSQCGETMQACDIPAHKTDACSLTQVHCIYCELSLERAAMAEHELYCGSRTEKCPECSELILIKYKKLHEESNHSFIKLDDGKYKYIFTYTDKISVNPKLFVTILF